VSEALRSFLATNEGLPLRKMIVIGHGIDATGGAPPAGDTTNARRRLGLETFDPLIGAVGRLSDEKGHLVLLRAFAAVLRNFPRAGCLIAGEGPARAALEAEAARLGISGSVRLAGFRRDVPGVLAALDLFVQPSLYEGFGLSLLEAMAAGRAVVASRVGGIPEIVDDGVTGVLVPPRDATALAAAILGLLADGGSRRRMAQAAARSARDRHSLRASVDRITRLYDDILEGRA